MTRSEFINDLRSRIWNLPVDEVSAAIRYYDTFIVDAGITNEREVIERLGSPQIIADNIIREYNSNPQALSHDYSKTNPARDFIFGSNTKNSYSNNEYNSGNSNGYNNGNTNGYYNYHKSNHYNATQGTKRLYKSETDRMLFGVCGGLAEYFETDSSLIRIIAAFLALSGTGLVAYLVAAAVLPDKSKL